SRARRGRSKAARAAGFARAGARLFPGPPSCAAALLAESAELQPADLDAEAAGRLHLLLQALERLGLVLDDAPAAEARQVQMAVLAADFIEMLFALQVHEVEFIHQPQLLQQPERAVDGGQVDAGVPRLGLLPQGFGVQMARGALDHVHQQPPLPGQPHLPAGQLGLQVIALGQLAHGAPLQWYAALQPMDSLTHSLVGVALSRTFFKRRMVYATTAAVVAANLPDLDVVYSWPGIRYLEYHRGLLHSVWMVPVWALLVALGVRWAARRRGLEAPALWMGCALGVVCVGSHVLLDWANAYGVRLLAPFSQRWFALDWLPILDPWIYLILF